VGDLLENVHLEDREGNGDNINVYFREMSCEDLRRMELARDRVQ
jgi:hypothetical protein